MPEISTAAIGRNHPAVDLRWLVGLPVSLVAVGLLSASSTPWAIAIVVATCGAAWVAVTGLVAVAVCLVAALPWLVVFLGPIPDELRTVVAALGAGLAFAGVLSRSRASAWLTGAALLLVPALASLPSTSTAGAFQFLSYVAFVALVGVLASDGGSDVAERVTRIALPSACGALLVHAVVVVTGLGSIGTYYGSGERLGYAVSPHNLAFFASGVGIAAFLRFENAWARYGFLALGATATLLTGVRSAMVGLILFGVLMALRRGARLQQLGAIAAGVAAAMITGADQVLGERLLKSESSGEFQQFSSVGSGRGEIWTNAVGHWEDAGPIGWLLGTGLRTITEFSQQAFGRPFPGHNDLVEVGVQLGLVGLVGYLMLVLVVIRSASTKLVLAVLGAAALLNGALEYIAPMTLILFFAGARKSAATRWTTA